MSDDHPNIMLIQQLDPGNMAASSDLFAPDVVFHYFQPKIPDIEGDYVGLMESGHSSKPSVRVPAKPSRLNLFR